MELTLDGKTLKFDAADVESVAAPRDVIENPDGTKTLGTSHLNITFKDGKLPYWEEG